MILNKKTILCLLAAATIFLVAACSSDKKTLNEDDIKVQIRIPESVDVDFLPLLGEDYDMSDKLFAFKDGKNFAFGDKWGYPLDRKARVVDSILFADAEVLAEMFGLDYEQKQGDSSGRLTGEGLTVDIKADTDTITVNGEEKPFITTISILDTLMLPVKDFSEAMGYHFTYHQDTKISYIYSDEAIFTEERITSMEDNFKLYEDVVYNYSDVECDMTGVGLYEKTDPSQRLVGIAYTTWHRSSYPNWNSLTWDKPLLGPYVSDDKDIIYQHGLWLAEAGVDFVFVDWSNNTDYDPVTMASSRNDFRMIETATDALFDIWSTIPNAPKICIFVGPGHSGIGSVDNGNHQRKVDQIYRDYIENPERKDMYFYYEGKPLLMCYGATPTQYGKEPEWNDDRFTVRWVTGFVGQQGRLFDKETRRSERYWSWEERGAQTYTVYNGKVEAVTCSAATRKQGNPGEKGYIPEVGRENGATLKRQFQRAYELGAKIILIVSWNEWTTGEQPSVEVSKDMEPSQIHGTFYLDLMREQIRKFKGQI